MTADSALNHPPTAEPALAPSSVNNGHPPGPSATADQVIVINKRERNLCLFIIEVLFVFLLPPITALIERGCGIDLVLNILLTIFGWVPGMIHAAYLIIVGHGNVDVERPPGARTQALYVGQASGNPPPAVFSSQQQAASGSAAAYGQQNYHQPPPIQTEPHALK
jgi:uncharacterized membrane protein YqaE (UPF0057 family)